MPRLPKVSAEESKKLTEWIRSVKLPARKTTRKPTARKAA